MWGEMPSFSEPLSFLSNSPCPIKKTQKLILRSYFFPSTPFSVPTSNFFILFLGGGDLGWEGTGLNGRGKGVRW